MHNRYALSLAERGACLSAEQEHFKALWLSAQLLDAMHGGTSRSEALAAARQAFDESDDFARYLPENAGADVRPQIVGHKTVVLQNSPQPIAPLATLQGYYDYASTQLVRAVDGEPLASQALSGLAQIQALLLVDKHESTAPAKAIALFQSAIAVDPKNALAANELGVLFTKYGRLESAHQAFTLSLQAEQRPATWHNLARVYDLLGKPEMATQARDRKQTLLEAERARQSVTLRLWLRTSIIHPTIETTLQCAAVSNSTLARCLIMTCGRLPIGGKGLQAVFVCTDKGANSIDWHWALAADVACGGSRLNMRVKILHPTPDYTGWPRILKYY